MKPNMSPFRYLLQYKTKSASTNVFTHSPGQNLIEYHPISTFIYIAIKGIVDWYGITALYQMHHSSD